MSETPCTAVFVKPHFPELGTRRERLGLGVDALRFLVRLGGLLGPRRRAPRAVTPTGRPVGGCSDLVSPCDSELRVCHRPNCHSFGPLGDRRSTVLCVSRRLCISVPEIVLDGRKSIRRLCPSVQRSCPSPAVCSRFPPQFPLRPLMCLRSPVSQKVL